RKAGEKALIDFNECLRRTSNDVTICHRYKLYVDEAQKKDAAAGAALASCVSEDVPVKWRGALGRALPGHAARLMENRADGSAILWTYGPADGTAFVLELAPDGHEVSRNPLAANQIGWLRQTLGL
ncbi:MAG TPA: hypothetical protein VFH51_16940, partial [Myxococcota bacterium]|nr:hypothetical protein [Myxococcota bacterium]